MAELMIIIAELIDNEENRELRLMRAELRETINPFAISERSFRSIFRFSRDGARELIGQLQPFLFHSNRDGAIPPHLQVLTTLSFLSGGSYQRKVGQDFLACMSQSSVSINIHRVIEGLNELMIDWIKFPTTEEEIEEVQMDFWQKHAFPGVIGLMDGTHVAVVPLESEREHLLINRKGYHSLNVLIVCDSKNRITFVNATHGGRTHDSRVFMASHISYYLHTEHENGRVNRWLLGDSGYPLLPYLLTPMLHQPENTPGWRYTRSQIRVRSRVERVIGMLKGSWRCLRKDRVLHYFPEFSAKIVNACCVLHNMRIAWGIANAEEDEIYYDEIDVDEFRQVLNGLHVEHEDHGVGVREGLINNFFALLPTVSISLTLTTYQNSLSINHVGLDWINSPIIMRDTMKAVILDFIIKYPELAKGRVSTASSSNQVLKNLKQSLAEVINACEGTHKTAKQAYEDWSRWKSKTLMKEAQNKSFMEGIRGVSSRESILSDIDLRLLDFLGADASGFSGVRQGGLSINPSATMMTFSSIKTCRKNSYAVISGKPRCSATEELAQMYKSLKKTDEHSLISEEKLLLNIERQQLNISQQELKRNCDILEGIEVSLSMVAAISQELTRNM